MIPKKTQESLDAPFAVGTRHEAAVGIALQLMGNGLSPSEALARLTEKFSPGLGEKELNDIIRWAKDRAQPMDPARPTNQMRQYAPAPTPPKPKPPSEHAKWWLSGKTMTETDFRDRSQIAIPEGSRESLILALEMLYLGTDNLNVMCRFVYDEEKKKANPSGNGQTMTRDKWVEYVRSKGVPESQAGAWFRPNPCKAAGSGAGGAVTDSDVVAWRFLLLESDVLPIETQLALFNKLRLPIAMVTMSGGHSAHALVRLDAASEDDFDEKARRILTALQPFGIDPANKNPSRLSRFPGAKRVIGAEGTGNQTLLWVNPGKAAVTNDELTKFEDSMLLPALEEKPFRQVVQDALTRYQYLHENQGKLGVKIGLPTLDQAMGGWKEATMTVLAANTGVGKTTLAVNWINTALENNVGVAVFSMEMSRDDICDMLFSIRCKIDRNHFNTGEFIHRELESMTAESNRIAKLPLWVDDDATISLASIRRRTLQLCADGLIGLGVVDYAQLIDPEDKRETREQQVATIARGLRILSKESKLPWIVLSQVNDDGMLRESRVLSHEAANVFHLQHTKKGMMLFVAKGRKIPSKPIPIQFTPEYCRMAEGSPIQDKDVPPQTSQQEPPNPPYAD